MINKLSVQNYRVLRDVSVDLAPLTVLVGPNGVGKSTMLEALQYIVLMSQGQNPQGKEPWNQSPPSEAAIFITGDTTEFRQTGWSKDRNQPVVCWRIGGLEIVPGAANAPKLDAKGWPANFPSAVLRLHLDPKILRMDSQGPTPMGQIGELGQGLAAALNDLKTSDDPRYDAILSAMKQIVPGLKGIKAPRVPQNAGQFTISCATTARPDIPARHMSDGTLYALALITALSANQGRPTLVMLDDIDQGLHPKAQAELITQIRTIQKNDPGLQVIATCHSPYLVDSLEGDEVLLMHADADGYAQARRISEHKDYARLKGALGTGEFWGSVGEEWVTSATVPTAGAP